MMMVVHILVLEGNFLCHKQFIKSKQTSINII